MKRWALAICAIVFYHAAFSQTVSKSLVVDALTAHPIAGATIEAGELRMATDENGQFSTASFPAGLLRLKISYVGYRTLDTAITWTPGTGLRFSLSIVNLFLEPIEVHALRAGAKAPFAKTDISKKDIERLNLGQDLPFIVEQTPGVVANSDAGNGVGYTGIHIRGTDATRINMTLNGIPYNDAESQISYFVDLPDFASSVNSIQIQRGVGTSSNGAGAFGATINFSTNEFNEKSYLEVNNSFGSFNTWKNTIKAGSGLIGKHFTLDGRISRISSNGFIDRASSNLRSAYFSAAYFSKKSSIRINLLSGNEKTYQAWNGIPGSKLRGDHDALLEHYANNSGYAGALYTTPQDSINLFKSNNRTYNYFTYPNQTDNYRQDHYQLFFNHQFNTTLAFNAAGFLTRGKGYYEEYKSQQFYADYGFSPPVTNGDTTYQTDLVRRRWLSNYFYGGIFSVQYKNKGTQITTGGGWYRYNGQHYGNVIWTQEGGVSPNAQYYREPADKTDYNIYTKIQQQIGEFVTAFADMQYRRVRYQIDGFDDNPSISIDNTYQFYNPKAGITYARNGWQAFASYAVARHEPNRDDFEAGILQQPKPETLYDLEAGISKGAQHYNWGLTGYYMRYTDQLVLTGKINDVGSYTRSNIPRSYRLGIEMQGAIMPVKWLTIKGNLALSSNKVLNYTEYVDDYDNGGQKAFTYNKTDIAFSPTVVGAASVEFYPVRKLAIVLPSKFVSAQYLDNGQHQDRKLSGYYVQQLQVNYAIYGKQLKETRIIFQLNNVFNKKYEPNGYTYSYFTGNKLVTENFLFPMAGTNFMVALDIKL